MKFLLVVVEFHGSFVLMIERAALLRQVQKAMVRSRVVVLLGPRQCGKTTVARTFVHSEAPNYFDLEDPASLGRLEEPMTALRGLKGRMVSDEVQRRPELFPVLRVLADRRPMPSRFLILGGASPDLLLRKNGRTVGVERKRADAPRVTPSIRIALQELKLEQIAVVYPGTQRYALADAIQAVPFEAVAQGMQGLFPRRRAVAP